MKRLISGGSPKLGMGFQLPNEAFVLDSMGMLPP